MEPKLTQTFKDTFANVSNEVQTGQIVSLGPVYNGSTPFPFKVAEPPKEAASAAKKGDKVAIIGTAPSSRMLAPFADTSWDIWVCSPGNQNVAPRVDAWFEIHKNLHWPEYESYGKPYLEWLSKQPFPVYMQDQGYFPHALTFPKEELVKEFGGDFFSSSFAWMMAFAISLGYKEIGLFGVDMASKEEYILQRPGFYYFKHEANRRGIKVSAPNESDIMQSPGLYGYSENTPFGRKIHAREYELKQRVAQLEQADIPKARAHLKNLEDNVMYLKGALEDVDYVKSIHIRVGGQG